MPNRITVEDALDLSVLSNPSWNADGSRVGYTRFEDGETILAVVDAADATAAETDPAVVEIRAPHDGVGGFEWNPEDPDTAAYVADGAVYRFDAEEGTSTLVDETAGGGVACPRWSPAGDRLAYPSDGAIRVADTETGGIAAHADPRGEVAEMFGGTSAEWDPDGEYVATFVATDAGALGVTAIRVEDPDDGDGTDPGADDSESVAWRHVPAPEDGTVVSSFEWVGPGHLVYGLDSRDGTERRYRSVLVDRPDSARTILSERDDCVLARDTPAGTDDGRFAVLSGRTGYHHVYVVDAERRRESVADADGGAGTANATGGADARPGFDGPGVTQVTEGRFEARGDAVHSPSWSESGDRLAFVTNEHDPGERRLFTVAVDANAAVGDPVPVAPDGPDGNVVDAAWSPDGERLACLRAGRRTPATVYVVDAAVAVGDADAGADAAEAVADAAESESAPFTRVVDAHPERGVFADFPDPEPVSFPSADGTTVHGYLYEPATAEAGDDRPAVVWCHGGPIRQMRRGFHHMRSYAVFHAFNHVLVDEGYAVLELNYRGGIGYGRAYEHGIHRSMGETDVADCVAAADYLRDRPTVGDSVGLWGLSYGGFLANAVATETDAYDCAVNFAGIWDWADWVRRASDGHWGAGRLFAARFGGHPDDDTPVNGALDHEAAEAVQERYDRASPGVDFDGLTCPLFALHGTADPNVAFDQLDFLVEDLVDAKSNVEGPGFETAYYPGEDHMFQDPATWIDAFERVSGFLDSHLR